MPQALWRMAADRPAVRTLPFGKLLGTASGTTFSARDGDVCRWALLAAWDSPAAAEAFETSRTVRGWDAIAEERWRIIMTSMSARGRWSGRQPFTPAGRTPGPAVAVTRARLRPRRAVRFWRALPPVAQALSAHDGCLLRFGMGEFPIGVQGTFSLWSSAGALTDFAYRDAAHRAVIDRTPNEGWYAEELFARFAVLGADGTIDGHNPLP